MDAICCSSYISFWSTPLACVSMGGICSSRKICKFLLNQEAEATCLNILFFLAWFYKCKLKVSSTCTHVCSKSFSEINIMLMGFES